MFAPFGLAESPAAGDDIVLAESDTHDPVIAKLAAFTMPTSPGTYEVDAALAELVDDVDADISYDVASSGELPITGVSGVVIDGLDVFQKGGTDTRLKTATIAGAVQSLRVFFDGFPVTLSSVFGCQRTTNAFGSAGDSGAIIFNLRGRAVALQVGEYSPQGESWALACPIQTVIRALEADFSARHNTDISLEIATKYRRLRLPNLNGDLAEAVSENGSDRQLSADVTVVAKTLWGEARGEFQANGPVSYQCVAEVIANRAERRAQLKRKALEPADFTAVCKAHLQFSCWNPGDPNLTRMNAVTSSDPNYVAALAIADAFVRQNARTNLTFGALHYHSTSMASPPSWVAQGRFTAQIGMHRFYADVPLSLAQLGG